MPMMPHKCSKKTNCDMVMIGRGALGNPWIFREINAWLNDLRPMFPPSPAEKVTVILRHIQAMCDYKGEEIAMREARKHVGWYMKGFKNAAELRREAGYLKTYEELIELTKKPMNVCRKANKTSHKKLKSFAQAFSKACSFKGRAFGRRPQTAKHFMLLKAQEGRKTFQWNVFVRDPRRGFPV